MQLRTAISKFLILALLTVLSCSFITTWDINSSWDAVDIDDGVQAGSIWNSLSHELKLDHQVNSAQVQAEIHKLLADQGKLNNILQAAGPYIYYIYKQTQAYGLPAEIALIPVIESEFNPYDHSKRGATGLWQLMPQTARELGIKVKSGYDGRRNVVASTNAALAYFRDLGNDFKGNWYLAIAAYDCGQGKIQSAEKRAGSHIFWNLSLPKETEFYVPKLLAVAAIIKNPHKYGVELPPVTNQPYFTQLNLKKPTTLTKVAQSTGVDVQTLHTLNPDYNHGQKPAAPAVNKGPNKDTYTLLVPANKAPVVKAQLADSIAPPATVANPPKEKKS